MADIKISQLPTANLPLDGTEVLPIVQSTTTKKVAISDVTAGRAIAATSLTLTTPLAVTSGGSGTGTAFTTGSFVFAGAAGVYSQNNARLYWDNTNFRVGINTNTPAVSLAISNTDAILVPVGTTGERPAGAAGYIRFNTSITGFEGYDGTNWRSVGGGASGGGTNQIFYTNDQAVTNNYTLISTKNAGTFGPVTINDTIVVTVESGATWTVV